MIRQKKKSLEKILAKIFYAKIYSTVEFYTNIAFYTLVKRSLSMTNKAKLETKHSFSNKTMKLQLVHYRYLAIKSFNEKDRLKVPH